MTATSVLVLGDLCVDTIVTSRLNLTWREAARAGEVVFRVPLDERVGGSAYHFAKQAASVGMSAMVVGAVGTDAAGDMVLSALAGEGLLGRVQRTDAAATARSVIAYDAGGARMMITSEASANDQLSAAFVQAHVSDLPPPTVIWLPGHCLRDRAAERWMAVAAALGYARTAGARLLLDIVPHDFHRLFASLDDVQSAVGPVDGISADLTSLLRWLHGGAPDRAHDMETLTGAVADALEAVPFVMSRFHDGTTYWQHAADRTGFRATEAHAVPGGGKLTGYGDFLACTALRGYLDHLTEAGMNEQGRR